MDNKEVQDKLIKGYENMLKHIQHGMTDLRHQAAPKLTHFIEAAQEKAVELQELSREEAEKIAAYLKRDLEDMGEYLVSDRARELTDWLKFDIKMVEQNLLKLFMSVADRTTREYLLFKDELRQQAENRPAREYHTGEITGIGTLHCTECNQIIHFHAPGHIPPCPKCHATAFQRANQDNSSADDQNGGHDASSSGC